MSGGDWFVLAIIVLEIGAALFYALSVTVAPTVAIMWLCLGLSNVFWLLGNIQGK